MKFCLENWLSNLSESQQILIILSLRDCDIVCLDDPSCIINKELRKIVLTSRIGRDYQISDLNPETEERDFKKNVIKLCNEYNKYPLGYFKRLLHASMIIGYKHPDYKIRKRWIDVYIKLASILHLKIESVEDLDNRLT